MRTTDYVELPLPCGTRLGLLVIIDPRGCRCGGVDCLGADQVARCLLREWHRETVPTDRPA